MSPVDKAKVRRTGKTEDILSVLRTQYIFFNNNHPKIHKEMKKTNNLDPQSAAYKLTETTLKKADHAFYRQRRTMEDSYGLPHGTIWGV